jgi:endonuclease/exonuclease/phosphatase family metal-dependent hydrolase
MAANITSGNYQNYDPGHGTRIFQGLDPDVVLIQEFNYGDNSAGAIAGWVQSTFGSGFTYYREGGAQIANGVVSRWPIVESGEWDDPYVSNRDFAWARIDIPGSKDLWAVSVHLLTSSSSTRNNEAVSLKSFIQSKVPAGDYLVIGGDFNTGTRSESALGTLSALVVTAAPWPVDTNGNGNTNSSRAKPYDWVLADTDLAAYEVPVAIGSNAFQNGLVFDSRSYTPLSEVAPVQSGDSGATNMQHMAVVRDFSVPDGGSGGGAVTLLDVSASVAQGAWKNYTVNVAAGVTQLQIDMTGSGDGDLYVRAGASYPTLTQYDFRPYLSGSNESVTITPQTSPPLQTGQYWISVHGYTAATFTLKAVVE